MQCAVVLSVTLVSSTSGLGNTLDKDTELKNCAELIQRKYAVRNDVRFFSADGYIDDVEQRFKEQDWSEVIKYGSEWAQDSKNKPGIGLYIQMHATESSWHVAPDRLANFVTTLYKQGLLFRKINLSACNTAGAPSSCVDPSHSLAMTFCKALSSNLSGVYGSLNMVMVAAYRAAVTFEIVEDRVRNVLANSKPSRPIRPSAPFGQARDELEALSSAISSKVRELDQTQKQKFQKDATKVAICQLQEMKRNHKEADLLYGHAKAYIGCKVAWQFKAASSDTGTWDRISLAAYTDGEEMRSLICIIEKIAEYAVPDTQKIKFGFVL